MTKQKVEKPYGFVLVLRGIARAAIMLQNHPAALRVVCIAAEYMNQDGVCRIGQGTIAARLEISRQAVNKHLQLLDRMEILIADAKKDGVTLRYYLNTDGLEDEREGQDRVDERRAAKRRQHPNEPPPKPAEQPAPIVKVSQDYSWQIGCRARHQKFGLGTISAADGNKLNIEFDDGQTRKVVADFVTIKAKGAGIGATSEIAGGAT